MNNGAKQTVRLISVIGLVVVAMLLSGGCKKAVSGGELLIAQLSNPSWDLGDSNSLGTVDVVIQGDGSGNIILESIRMTGDNPAANPVKAMRASFEGGHVLAKFQKNLVMDILSNPTEGSTHVITITFQFSNSDEEGELTSEVTISAEGESNDFVLEIDPAEWNLNFDKSNGTVEMFLRGEGLENIDLETVEMIYAESGLTAKPDSVKVRGDHLHARFFKKDAIALLTDPAVGDVATISLGFFMTDENGGEPLGASADITIVEDDDDDGTEPGDLTMEIDPDVWSLNFPKSNGTVTVIISGEGYENIDTSTILLRGDSDVSLAPFSSELKGDHLHLRFAKSQVLDILDDPEEGDTRDLYIVYRVIDGTEDLEWGPLTITIEEDDDDGDDDDDDGKGDDFELRLVPKKWNLNYDKDKGHVTAFIYGSAIDSIDLDSIVMEGDGGGTLEATSAAQNGNHVQADFPKNQVLGLLDSPAKGSTHTVKVSFQAASGTVTLEADISIK